MLVLCKLMDLRRTKVVSMSILLLWGQQCREISRVWDQQSLCYMGLGMLQIVFYVLLFIRE